MLKLVESIKNSIERYSKENPIEFQSLYLNYPEFIIKHSYNFIMIKNHIVLLSIVSYKQELYVFNELYTLKYSNSKQYKFELVSYQKHPDYTLPDISLMSNEIPKLTNLRLIPYEPRISIQFNNKTKLFEVK